MHTLADGMGGTDPHNTVGISQAELRGNGQTSCSKLQGDMPLEERLLVGQASGKGQTAPAKPRDHTSAFQGSTTLTMATSESLLSIPHICSLPRTSQSCRF